jgi:hypothetical protein
MEIESLVALLNEPERRKNIVLIEDRTRPYLVGRILDALQIPYRQASAHEWSVYAFDQQEVRSGP